MKVLFCLEPHYDLGLPYVMSAWLQRFHRMHEQLKVFADEYEGRLLTWEGYEYRLQGPFMGERIVCSQAELRQGWQAMGNLYPRLEWGRAEPAEVAAAQELIRNKLVGFQPDVVLLITASDWLRPVLPDALFLNVEATWLWAPPHFDLWQLDPAGFGKGRSLVDHAQTWLGELEWDAQRQAFCTRIKEMAATLWPAASQDVRDELRALRQRYRRLILVPLGDFAPSDGETPVMSILDWFLERSDPQDAWLVTHHPNAPALNRAHVNYLTSKYPQLQVDARFSTGALLPEVDAVLGDFTSASAHALLFDKPVLTLGDDCPFAGPRFQARSPLCHWLAKVDAETRDKALYWLLTRYSIPQDRLTNGLWLSAFLQRALTAFRSGAAWQVFDTPIVDQAEWEAMLWFVEVPVRPVDEAALAAQVLQEVHRKRYQQAEREIEAGGTAEAVQLLQALVAEGTTLWEPYNDLAVAAAGESDWEQAESLLRDALQVDHEARQARINLVAVLMAQGRFEPALAELGPLMRKEPMNPEVFNLARDIVGQAPALSTVAWIRLVADIRAPRVSGTSG